MKGRLPQLSAAALVVVCASLVTPVALAGSGKPTHHKKSSGCVSAVCVYHEQVPTAGGQQPVGSDTGPPVKVSKKVGRALSHYHGKDAAVLKSLVTNPGYGATRVRLPHTASLISSPSAIGAAFDLGTGPLALFVGLLAGALLMGGGMVLRRRSRAPARSAR